jgi:hypothetical protein
MHAFARAALGGALLTGLAACQSTRPPTAPSNVAVDPAVVRVVLGAPATLAPGATYQLALHAVYSDGTSRDVTPIARFFGEPANVVAVSPAGLVTALAPGDARVTGHTDRSSTTSLLVVVPDGTFRVVGRVFEEAAPEVSIGGARVEAEGGPAAVTDFEGRFRLFGVPPQARLRVTKPGYAIRELLLGLSDHHTENVPLAAEGPGRDYTGRYQLSFEAAADCRDALPDALRTRRYSAAVTQVGSEVRLVLGGAHFLDNGAVLYNVVRGRVNNGGNSLDLDMFSLGHCEVPLNYLVEVIDGKYLEIEGRATLSRTGTGLSGTLSGSLQLLEHPQCQGHPFTALGSCQSRSHRITLTR